MNTNNSRLTSRLLTADDRFFTAMKILPNPDKILAVQGGGNYSAFRALEDDPHLWSCIQSRKSGCISRGFSIIPAANSDNAAAAEEIRRALSKLDMYELMRNILEAPLFGFQPLEVIWEIDSANRIMPQKIIPRRQESFCFSPEGDLLMRKESGDISQIPDFKILCPRFEPGAGNPYGHSLLSKCYWHVIFKSAGLKNWVKFSEKYGMPILVGQYTRGCTADEAEKLADALCSMTEDSVIVSPSDISVELKEASQNSSAELYSQLISHCNSEISKAILSQTLTTELESGSYAASETHYKVRKEVILADSRLIEDTVNELINWYFEVNYREFAAIKIPKFKLSPAADDLAERLENDLKIAKESGYRLSENYLARTYGYAPGDLILNTKL